MIERLKRLGRDALVYGVGSVLAKSISFLLLPVYTRIFTPEEYGLLEMLTLSASLLAAALNLEMDSAQSFYFFEQRERGKQAQASVVSTILGFRLLWGAPAVLIATVVSPLFSAAFFDGALQPIHFGIAFAAALFGQILAQSVEIYRLLYRPLAFTITTLSATLLSAALSLTAIWWLRMGVLGFFVGSLVASATLAAINWYLLRSHLRFRPPWFPMARLLRFALPLVPGALAMYLLQSTDRWVLAKFRPAAELGLYALGAKFALLLAATIETFRQAWWPTALDAMHSADGPPVFRLIGRLYLGAASAGAVLLTLLAPLLVDIFAAPDFRGASPLVGVLGWSAVFYGFYLIGAAGLWKAERTWLASSFMGAAAVLNLALAWWWVPSFGAMGAAVAAALSFLAWNILALFGSERAWPVGYQLPVAAGQVGFGVAATAWIIALRNQAGPEWLAWACAAGAVAGVVLLTLSRDVRAALNIFPPVP